MSSEYCFINTLTDTVDISVIKTWHWATYISIPGNATRCLRAQGLECCKWPQCPWNAKLFVEYLRFFFLDAEKDLKGYFFKPVSRVTFLLGLPGSCLLACFYSSELTPWHTCTECLAEKLDLGGGKHEVHNTEDQSPELYPDLKSLGFASLHARWPDQHC